ncbi:hypothetical protein BHM03_00033870 [Ensete ventricosum]|nr:hypothetical protein BHM03_00033870 [Ensete ventricosum]
MAMRDLVTGGAACAVPGTAASSSNPFGALSNAILGSSSKTQELKGLPGSAVNVPGPLPDFRTEAPLSTIPGLENEGQQHHPPVGQNNEFLARFRTADHGVLADAWNEIHQPPALQTQGGKIEAQFQEFEQIYNRGASSMLPPAWDGMSKSYSFRFWIKFLHSFVDSGRVGVPFRPAALPVLGYLFQVNALLHSLDIDGNERLRGPVRGSYPELEEYWTESQGALRSGMPYPADKWVSEFARQRENGDPEAWAHSFEQLHGANGWASEFEQEQSQLASVGQVRGANMSHIAAMEQSRMLAHTLAQNNDPKFQVRIFIYDALPQGTDKWVNEFVKENQQQGVDDQWVNEFSKLHVQDWAEEFGQQVAEGALGDSTADDWANTYENFLDEQLLASKQHSGASRGVYVFSDMNPYVGHPNPLREGQELFRKGLLSEAVLALEAEVLKNPDNAEGWRLLGITHAENDDDQQAIAAMMRAQEVDPTNLEVLLALGVSHTNGKYCQLVLLWATGYFDIVVVSAQLLLNVARLFNEAAQMSPEDADVHIVLGVLYNLSREYDKAIESFQTALNLKPRDYSLWNKLGATRANSIQSADAILAYQQVGQLLGHVMHL